MCIPELGQFIDFLPVVPGGLLVRSQGQAKSIPDRPTFWPSPLDAIATWMLCVLGLEGKFLDNRDRFRGRKGHRLAPKWALASCNIRKFMRFLSRGEAQL